MSLITVHKPHKDSSNEILNVLPFIRSKCNSILFDDFLKKGFEFHQNISKFLIELS